MKIAIFGGGFISKNLGQLFSMNSHEVVVLTRNPDGFQSCPFEILNHEDADDCRKAKNINFDIFVIAAAMTPASDDFAPTRIVDVNLGIVEKAIELYVATESSSLVFLSTTAVFGERPPIVIPQDFICHSDTLSPYGYSKLASEKYLMQHHRSIILRLPGVVWSHAPQTFIPRLIGQIFCGRQAQIYSREALFNGILSIPTLGNIILDLAGIALKGEQFGGSSVINLGAVNPITLEKLSTIIADFFGVPVNIIENPVGRSPYVIDVEELRHRLSLPDVRTEVTFILEKYSKDMYLGGM